MAGLKVERLHRVGVGDPAQFVVGRGAQRRARTRTPTGSPSARSTSADGDASTIVCGAPNVAAGQTVAVARPGAVMPDGSKLGKAKLRGVESHGMILAEDEVGIGEDHEGIMVLAENAQVGAPLAEHLPIVDEVLELEITPNRPDAMGVYGVARDLHAVTAAPLAPDPTDADAEPSGDDRAEDHASVEIADPEICLRFTARVFEDVKIGPSPLWLKQRLMAAGQRPISNVVDITNYVMLTTAQPLHAFDLDEVRGRSIVVRRAQEGEKMTTLDGVERTFSSDMALVCDAEGPSGIAGVMGGEISEVSDSTTRVLMEAATWVGPNIMRTSKALGLRTEASARFEKQLHPEQAIAAQRLAARLMVELCGARMVPGTIDAYPQPGRAARGAAAAPSGWSGCSASASRRRRRTASSSGSASAHDRRRLARPALARQRRPARGRPDRGGRAHPRARQAADDASGARAGNRAAHRSQPLRRRLEDLLRDRGLLEAISYSFTSPDALARLRLTDAEPLRVENPLSEDLSLMRPLILPGLLDAAQHNAAHGRAGVRLFESAHVYLPTGTLAPLGERGQTPSQEDTHICALLTEAAPAGWRTPARAGGLLRHQGAARGADGGGGRGVACAGGRTRRSCTPAVRRRSWPPTASSSAGSASCTRWCCASGSSTARWRASSWTWTALLELAPEASTYSDVTSFPAVLQDIAVIVPDDVSGGAAGRGGQGGRGRAAALAARVRPLPRRAGGGGKQVAGPPPRVPRAGPHAHRRGGRGAARGDRAASWNRSEGKLRA